MFMITTKKQHIIRREKAKTTQSIFDLLTGESKDKYKNHEGIWNYKKIAKKLQIPTSQIIPIIKKIDTTDLNQQINQNNNEISIIIKKKSKAIIKKQLNKKEITLKMLKPKEKYQKIYKNSKGRTQ